MYKMNFVITAYVVILFILLTPNTLVRLPPNGDKMTVTLVHALIFGLVFSMTHNTMMKLSVPGGKSNYCGDKTMMAGTSDYSEKMMY